MDSNEATEIIKPDTRLSVCLSVCKMGFTKGPYIYIHGAFYYAAPYVNALN